MTALSANRDCQHKEGVLVRYPVKASTTIYKGAGVCVDATGYLVPAADTSGHIPVGVAFESGDNSSGSSGDVYVKVWKKGSFKVAMSSAAITDVGSLAYWSDDQTVATSTTNSISAGYIVEYVDSSNVRVIIDNVVQ